MSAEQLKILKKPMKWCMEWCTNLPYKGQSRRSPVFLLNDNEFHFEFLLDGSDDYTIYLRGKHEKLDKQELKVNFEVSLKGATSILFSEILDFKSTNFLWFIGSWRLKEIMPLSVSNDCLKFVFFCNSEFQPCLKIDVETNEKSTQTSSYADTRFLFENVSKDFSKLLEEGPNYDVQFTCEDQTIGAHKNILCCRSDVFATMLQSDMVEGKTGKVNIKDMNADVFRKFLKWLYTGYLPELTIDTAVEFYKASDKYALNGLKNQCVEFLIDNLSLENACEILVLADRHSDADFKKGVINYILEEKIPIKGENWTDFCNENQKLAIEVLNLFCQHMYNS